MKKIKRVEWVDYARGICAFCVLLAHNKNTPQLYLSMVTPFFLMLFFFISGYLYREKPLKESIQKLFNNLIFPYFALNFILIAIGFDNIQAIMEGNYNYVIDKIVAVFFGKPLWFISCLIMAHLYYIAIIQLLEVIRINSIKGIKITIAILFLLSVYAIRNWNYESTYWYADNAVFALAYFIFGNCYRSSKINLALKNKMKNKILAYFILSVFFIIAIFSLKHCDVEFHVWTNYYKSPVFFIIISFIGIASVLFFSMNAINYDKKNILNNYIKLLGINSLLLFAFNGKASTITNLIFMKLNIKELMQTDYCYVLIFSFFQGILIILLSTVVNKYVPHIVGKKSWIR